jgi:hypothetical protein
MSRTTAGRTASTNWSGRWRVEPIDIERRPEWNGQLIWNGQLFLDALPI